MEDQPELPASKNEIKSKVQCPYCLAQINSRAEVCCHCGRDVGRLIRTEARIKELESEKIEPAIVDSEDLKKHTTHNPWGFRIPMYSFYALAIYIYFVLPEGDYRNYILYIMAFITGVAIMFFRRDCNIWMLFLVGFAMLFFLTIFGVIILEFNVKYFPSILGAFFLFSALYGGLTALGGVAVLVSGGRLKAQQFSLSPLSKLLDKTESKLVTTENMILRVAAFFSAINGIRYLITKLLTYPG